MKIFVTTAHNLRSLPVLLAAAAAALLASTGMAAGAEAAQTLDARISDGALRVKGTAADDQLTLRLRAGDTGVIELDVGDDGTADFAFQRALAKEIRINARAGDDLVRIDEANGTIVEATVIQGGRGDDVLLGGSAVETMHGGPGDDFIDGNRANDVAFMGAGDDTFRWDPGDASDVVEGAGGNDTMLFNGANGGESVDISANGERVTFFRQPGNIVMDLNDVETAAFVALGGPDSIVVNELTGTDVTNVDLNLDAGLGTGAGDGSTDLVMVLGTAGDDTIAVAGSTGNVSVSGLSAEVAISAAEFANDQLNINTLGGDDTVDTSGLAAAVIQLFVDA